MLKVETHARMLGWIPSNEKRLSAMSIALLCDAMARPDINSLSRNHNHEGYCAVQGSTLEASSMFLSEGLSFNLLYSLLHLKSLFPISVEICQIGHRMVTANKLVATVCLHRFIWEGIGCFII